MKVAALIFVTVMSLKPLASQAAVLPDELAPAGALFWTALQVNIDESRAGEADTRIPDFLNRIRPTRLMDADCVQKKMTMLKERSTYLKVAHALQTYIDAERNYVVVVGFDVGNEYSARHLLQRAIVCPLRR
jgi:hypothetical protein